MVIVVVSPSPQLMYPPIEVTTKLIVKELSPEASNLNWFNGSGDGVGVIVGVMVFVGVMLGVGLFVGVMLGVGVGLGFIAINLSFCLIDGVVFFEFLFCNF